MDTPASPKITPPRTVEEFLKAVLRSGVLTAAQLKAAIETLPPRSLADAPLVADHLVRTGRLSRFQAKKLLKGVGRGLIFGPYQILAPIGKGGMGTVYLARAPAGTLVALKVLPPEKARAEGRMLARFRREMALTQKLPPHPHVATTYAAGDVRGVHYLAMEFIPGKSLHRLVIDEGPLPVARAARLMSEVALGLHHAHDHGLVHRDLKPSNILVTPHDHAKVLDLGLALIEGERADARIIGGDGYIVGTMDYIAPEQTLDAAGVDARADVYALGCTLYFALAGQPPFPGGTSKEKIYRHRGAEPVPLGQLVPDLSPSFALLVRQLMAKDPVRRPVNAESVHRMLAPWAAGEEPPPDELDAADYDRAVAAATASADSSAELDLGDAPAWPEPEPPPGSGPELDRLAEGIVSERRDQAERARVMLLWMLATAMALCLAWVVAVVALVLLVQP